MTIDPPIEQFLLDADYAGDVWHGQPRKKAEVEDTAVLVRKMIERLAQNDCRSTSGGETIFLKGSGLDRFTGKMNLRVDVLQVDRPRARRPCRQTLSQPFDCAGRQRERRGNDRNRFRQRPMIAV